MNTRRAWEKKARTVPCPTCNAQPGVGCRDTWTNGRMANWVTELSHWRRMQTALGGRPDWWRKVAGATDE
jgi:hypothetical protein